MSPLAPLPIFEPEFSFLPFACDDCGTRFASESELSTHRSGCALGRDARSLFGFDVGGNYGVADGGRRT